MFIICVFRCLKFHQSGRAGLVANDNKAVSLMKAASKLDRDFMRSQTSMGMVYLQGKAGHERDDTEAALLFTSAAEQGYARAQYNLGLLYDKGRGVERNLKTAAMWYRKAASQDHPASQHNLALRYMQGLRSEWSPQNDKEAVHLFKLGSSHMHPPSLTCLAMCFEHGIGGLEQDVGKAIELCHQAIDEGYFKAKPHLNRMRLKQTNLDDEPTYAHLEPDIDDYSQPSLTPSAAEFLKSGRRSSRAMEMPNWEGLT
jgi:TPR repeat protein